MDRKIEPDRCWKGCIHAQDRLKIYQLQLIQKKMYYVYVKAPLRVMYRKYSMRGGVEWQTQNEAKPSAVFARDPTPSTVFFHTSRVNGALTDLLFCVGRISSSHGS